MPNPDHNPTHIYAAAHNDYWQNGWTNILPLPPRAKKYPPTGYTGNHGHTPSYPDMYAWAEERPDANIALRLPPHIVGFDVDNYDTKQGGTTLHDAIQKWGPLPNTWRTTSRDDGTSGIRLYRIPPGLTWPTGVGDSIEIIRYAHRYAVVWPSIHPETGHTYRWINPDGHTTIGDIPHPDDLPILPAPWVEGLTNNQQATDRPQANLTDPQAHAWLKHHGTGDPCFAIQKVTTRRAAELLTPGATRHDVLLEATQRIAYLAAEGHPGATQALDGLHKTFITIVTKDGTRPAHEAQSEWDRALTGAIRNAAAQPAIQDGDPCTDPFASLSKQAAPTANELIQQATTPAPTPNSTTEQQPDTDNNQNDDDDDELTPSWRPIDLTPFLDGTWQPAQPTYLYRTDNIALLYPGLVHDLHGESESGKSLVIQAETATRIAAGDHVLYIDFESDAGQIAHRLLSLGATTQHILNNLTYIRPDASPYALTEAPEWAALLKQPFTLAVLDGVTDAVGMFGGAIKENDDIAQWHRLVPRTLARRTGATVVLIDHVAKNTETRGRFAIGGQSKMAAIDGASYAVEITEPIGKGMRGTITLRVGKDRPGEIRANCGAWRSADRTQEAARIVIDSTTNTDSIYVEIQPPTSTVQDPTHTDQPFRPTGVMEKLSRLIEARREPLSQNQLLRAYKGDGGQARDATVYTAINLLVEEAHLHEAIGARNARMFQSKNVYRQRTDPTSDSYDMPLDLPGGNDSVTHESAGHDINPPLPTSSPPLPGRGQAQGRPLPAGRVAPEAPPTGKKSGLPPQNTHNDVTSSRGTTASDWRLDYQLGEYIHRHTGEVWDSQDHDGPHPDDQ